MSRFPKFHGISLAAGAFIENLRAERLESDPVAAGPGRIWYNTTERLLKYTSLNESGGVVVQVFGNPDAIEALAERLDTVESEYVDAEFVAAKIAELGDAVVYVGELTPGDSEGDALDLSGLSETRAGSYYKVDAAGYVTLGDKTRYVNRKDGVLFNASGTFDVVDNTNSEVDGTAEFVTVSGSADTGFTIDLAASFKARIVDLEQGLADEVQAREAGDAALSGRLDDAESAIGAESQAREDAVSALSDRLDATEGLPDKLNAQRYAYQSSAAAIEHVIDHNLGSLFVSAVVWTEGSDGVYRQDIVEVEETNANRLTVRLTESAKIKAAIQVVEAV